MWAKLALAGVLVLVVAPSSATRVVFIQQGQPQPQQQVVFAGASAPRVLLPGFFSDEEWGHWASLQLQQALGPGQLLPTPPRRHPCPLHQLRMALLQGDQHAAAQPQAVGAQDPLPQFMAASRFGPDSLAALIEQATNEVLASQGLPAAQPEVDEEGEEEAAPEGTPLEENPTAEENLTAEEPQQAAPDLQEAVLQAADPSSESVEQGAAVTLASWEGQPQLYAVQGIQEGVLAADPRPPPRGWWGPPRDPDSRFWDFFASGFLGMAALLVWARAVVGFLAWRREARALAQAPTGAASHLSQPLLAPLSPEKPLAKGAVAAPIEVARNSVDQRGKYVDLVYVPLKGSA